MSVVNKMLKDLEQREGNRVYEADYVPIESNSTKSRRFFVGGILVVIATAIAVWLLLPSEEKEAAVLAKAPLSNLTILPPNATPDQQKAVATSDTVSIQDLDANTLASLSNPSEETPPKAIIEAPAEAATKAAAEVRTEAPSQNTLVGKAKETSETPALTQQAVELAAVKTESVEPVPEPRPAPALKTELVKETSRAEGVFSVSSNTKSTSNNRMLEQQIQLSLQNGDTPAAIKDLNELISLEPRNVSARKRLASLLFANGDPVRAAMLLHQGLQLSPEDSSMRLMQARLLFREKKNRQALALLKEHPPMVIADDELLSFRAALAEKQSDYQTSHEDYSTLLQRQPNNARWILGLAISQDKQLMHEQAVSNYRKVKSSNQLSAQVLSFVDGRLAVLAGS
jgi:MSHA biogenesis protein MshN